MTNETLHPIIPRPTQAERIEDPRLAPSQRRLDCQRYDGCVDAALAGGWRGFHCNACQAYEPLTPTQRLADFYALLELLARTQLLTGLRHHAAFGADDEDAVCYVPFNE
jgi:hypothetical protein